MTNARISRERREQAKLLKAEEEFEQEKLRIMRENFQVFECSGTQHHAPTCDGNCEVVALEGLDLEIAKELTKWDELGMIAAGSIPGLPIPGIPVNVFELELRFLTLLNVITEKLNLNTDDVNQRYAQTKLDRLRSIRESNEKAIREANSRSKVALPEKPELFIPDAIKRKMQ